jgi:hypothetical protein
MPLIQQETPFFDCFMEGVFSGPELYDLFRESRVDRQFRRIVQPVIIEQKILKIMEMTTNAMQVTDMAIGRVIDKVICFYPDGYDPFLFPQDSFSYSFSLNNTV